MRVNSDVLILPSASFGLRTRPPAAIFVVTDAGFAFPTIAAALEIRAKTPAHIADIRFVTVGFEPHILERLRHWLVPLGIDIDVLDPVTLDGIDFQAFKGGITATTLARFVMLDCVPDHYERILYIDGDVWPTGPLAELLTADLPENSFAAAEDRSFFWRTETSSAGRTTRAYYDALGIRQDDGYFNAGIILSSSAAWRTICGEAFDFFKANQERCRYYDQSALNAIAGRRRLRLNAVWNYQQDYAEWEVSPRQPPRLVHFCGRYKPWRFRSHPNFALYQPTRQAISEHGLSELLLDIAPEHLPRGPSYQAIKHNVVSHFRNIHRRRLYATLEARSVIG